MNDNNKKQALTVLSWNVNGFSPKKAQILNYLSFQQADVVFLQETHIGPSADCPAGSIQMLGIHPDYDWAVFTVFKNTCRGVAILIRKGLGCEALRMVSDDKGRYLIIRCRIQEKDFEFINVYNTTDEWIDFIQFVGNVSSTSEATYTVIGGDFNTVMDAEVDKTSILRNRGHKVRCVGLKSFLENLNLVDVWRWLYPEEKRFTYFDVKGKSRLDYIFLPHRNLTSITACKIHGRPQYLDSEGYISDHAPITVQIQTKGPRWQLHSWILRDKGTMEQLLNVITRFSELEKNRKGDLWPALKGRVICEMLDLKNCQNDFKCADKQISHVHENKTLEQKGLLGSTSHCQMTHSSHFDPYLDYLFEAKMSEDTELMLDAILTEPVSKKEILSAIFSLHNSDNLTPDGLSVAFYKHFACKLTDLLQAFFNQVLDLQHIKYLFNESFTPETYTSTSWGFDYADHNYCVQHQSEVTIFNVDYNILASILAFRLNSIMGHMRKQVKNGPLLSVQDYINTFDRIKADNLPVLAISVKVNPSTLKWPYLFHRLKTLKLPHRFRSVVRSLVQALQPSTRGLKVGCPLTPSLTSICLLPLIQSVELEKRLKGVRVGGELVTATLEGDRALLFLSNPLEALHVFEEVLKDFMENSGFMIDSRLSEVFITGQPGFILEEERLHLFKRSRGFWYKGVFVGSESPVFEYQEPVAQR